MKDLKRLERIVKGYEKLLRTSKSTFVKSRNEDNYNNLNNKKFLPENQRQLKIEEKMEKFGKSYLANRGELRLERK